MPEKLAALQAKHREALASIRAALAFGDPRRMAMLKQLDEIARAISAAETTKALPR
jgi:hypothetical protein